MKFLFEFITEDSVIIEASDIQEALNILIEKEFVQDKMLLEKILTTEFSLKERIKLINHFLCRKSIKNIYEINKTVFDWNTANEMEYNLID